MLGASEMTTEFGSGMMLFRATDNGKELQAWHAALILHEPWDFNFISESAWPVVAQSIWAISIVIDAGLADGIGHSLVVLTAAKPKEGSVSESTKKMTSRSNLMGAQCKRNNQERESAYPCIRNESILTLTICSGEAVCQILLLRPTQVGG